MVSLRYLLDTNMCIYIAKQRPIQILHKFENLVVGEAAMSTITYGELLYGAEKSQHRSKALAILEEITGLIPVLPIPTEAGRHYGKIQSQLEKQGCPIGGNDLLIAAHTLSLEGVTLITNNVKEFSRIHDLKIENWV